MAITQREAEWLDDEFTRLCEDPSDMSQQTAYRFMNAWEKLWSIMVRENRFTPNLGSSAVDWQVGNWAGDTCDILHNAKLYPELVLVCEQILKIDWGKGNELFHENARRDMADAYADMGQYERCMAMYRQYLKDDPLWGWGWIGYYRQLHDHNDDEFTKVLDSLYARICKGERFRDLRDLLDELSYEYGELGNTKVSENLRRRMFTVSNGRLKR